MAFDRNVPAAHAELTSEMFRAQFTGLDDKILAAMAALDWSNGAPKLPDYMTIANPAPGNIAFDYSTQTLRVYGGGEWMQIG